MKSNRNAGIALSYVNTVLNMICGLFLSSYLMRKLGDTNYGVYQNITSFANYLVLLEFGTGTVMTRNLSVCRSRSSSKEEIQRNISTIWTITGVLALLIAAVSVVFYFCLDTIYSGSMTAEQIEDGKKIFIVITVYLLASFLVSTMNGVVLAHEKYTLQSKISIARILTRTLALIGIISFYKYSIVIACVDAVLSVAVFVFLFVYVRRELKVKVNFSNFDRAIFNASLPLCTAIFLQTLVNQANSSVAKFITGIKLAPELVTLYSVGLYIYSMFSSLTTIPISMYAPQITRDVIGGTRGKELTEKLVQPSRLIAIVGGTVLFGFVAVGRSFISIVYGNEYMQAWFIALIIMIPMFINMSNGVIINVLDAMNKRMSRSIVLSVTTGLNIILTIVLIDVFGVVGAALSTGICTFLGQVLMMNIYYQKVIGIHVLYMFKEVYKGIIVYQILGAAVGFAVSSAISLNFVSFIVGGMTYVAISFGGFILFGKNETEKQVVDKFTGKLFHKR